ncbi:hypothetical protein ACPOLB_10560 [Rubrivivax sp. RP6-9]|uniref:hypothetical protein n=1 Tax=Rubrivivax sp. RP6-9 TaxID=3415750 RepID=UPI003CC58366
MASGTSLHLPHTRRSTPVDGTLLFLALFCSYVGLLGLAQLAGSGLLKALANAWAVLIFGLLAGHWLLSGRRPQPAGGLAAGFAVFYTGMACTLVVNPQVAAWNELLKILLVPLFLVFGAAFERGRVQAAWQQPAVRLCFWLLVAVPLAVFAVQLVRAGFVIDGTREAGVFSNRNNAALYAVTLLGLLGVLRGQPVRSVLLYVLVGVMFGTLGVLLAVLLALLLGVGRRRELLVLLVVCALGTAGYLLFPDVGPYSRITPVVQSVQYLADGRIDLRTVTFAQLVLLLKTTDLSFLFRLKHWLDLWDLYAAASPYQWFFGFGVSQSVPMSRLHLVPHNDYVRFLFEFGLFGLAGFVWLVWRAIVRSGRGWQTVPLLVVAIYCFSENLIGNYTAMAIFFFSAGALAQRRADAVRPPPRADVA